MSTPKRHPKPTKRYEAMKCAAEKQRLRLGPNPQHRGKNAALKARLLAAEPAVLPPPIPSDTTKMGYYGVVRASASDHAHRNRKQYQARVPVGNSSWVHLGSYATAEEAGRHAAAAHNALLEGLPPVVAETPVAETPVVAEPPVAETPVVVETPVVETPPVVMETPPIKRRRGSSSGKPTMRWTEDEDKRLIQILFSPEFDAPLNRRGGISGGSTLFGIGDEAYWRRVAAAMGYENTPVASRRCSRRWWYVNPENAEQIEAKRRERERAKAHVVSKKCLTETLDNVVFGVDEDPFELLAVTEDAQTLEEDAQNIIVRLSQLKEPIDTPKEIDLHAHEVLSDLTAERSSDVGDLDFLDDFETMEGGVYQFYSRGGLFTRVVKRTRTLNTKARYVNFTFRPSNLGRVILKQAEQHRMKTSKYVYQKRYHELKKREAFAAAWRATGYDASSWRAARDQPLVITPPTPAPAPPAPEPPPQDATLAPPLVQEHMETYLKVCKSSTLATAEEGLVSAKESRGSRHHHSLKQH